MDSYGKTNLIDDLTARTSGVTKRQITEILDATLGLVQEQVKNGKRVTIPGFGTWAQTQRAARTGVNIRTKQKIQIPAQKGVRFSAGATFKAAVSGKTMPPTTSAAYAKERALGATGGSALGEKIRQKVKTRGEKRRG
jgi:DNA-binding protein HU-beta